MTSAYSILNKQLSKLYENMNVQHVSNHIYDIQKKIVSQYVYVFSHFQHIDILPVHEFYL